MLEETVAVNVVHEHDAHHRGQIRETPIAFDPLLQYHEQLIGDQCDPNLNFDGIGALSIEISEGKILFELLEK